jgi:DNA-binding HxlR family transcriptional regulator
MSLDARKYSNGVCPIKKTAELLSDVWTILIIRELIASKKRFSELEKILDGISTRTLTLKLNKLILEVLITKKDNIYSLTKSGQKLHVVFDAMATYGKKYMNKRRAYRMVARRDFAKSI